MVMLQFKVIKRQVPVCGIKMQRMYTHRNMEQIINFPLLKFQRKSVELNNIQELYSPRKIQINATA